MEDVIRLFSMHVSALSLEDSKWATCHYYHYHCLIFLNSNGATGQLERGTVQKECIMNRDRMLPTLSLCFIVIVRLHGLSPL